MLFASFFGLGKNCLASSGIIINEILAEKADDNKYEFIELYNTLDCDISLSNYKLTKKSSTGTESTLISSSKFSGTIPAHGYFLISPPDYKTTLSADLAYSGFSYSFSTNNALLLYDSTEIIIDKVGFGIAKDYENFPAINPADGKSISRKFFQDTDNNSVDFNLPVAPTPQNSGHESVHAPAIEKVYSDKIYINELLPKPLKDSGQEEFVEIYNPNSAEEKLDGWKLQDRAKSVCDLSGLSVKAGDFLVIKATEIKKLGNKCTLTLNDTKGEEVSLLNPDGKIVSVIAYSGTAKENYSYSFDGSGWKWTEFSTPGEENEFADYSGKIRIIALSPNPKGKDADKEWIEIKNGTKKEINLKNWSIATGWKKLSNHPIRKDFKIKPGKSKKLTKKICAFTLNNAKNKLELRDPLGEAVQKIKYDKKKEKMLDDEVYQITGKKWSWKNTNGTKIDTNKTKEMPTNTTNNTIVPAPVISEEELKLKEEAEEIENNVDKSTPKESEGKEETDEEFSKIQTPKNLALNNPLPKFSTPECRVLGAYDIRETGTQYFFTPPIEQKHWAKVLWENANAKINSVLWSALAWF